MCIYEGCSKSAADFYCAAAIHHVYKFQQSVSWFSEHNATKFQESVNVIQPLKILLWKFDTPTGFFDILRPRNRPLPTLISTPLSLCLLVCTQCCHVICKAERIPASANNIQHIIPKAALSQAGCCTGQNNASQNTLHNLLYRYGLPVHRDI